MKPTRLDAWIMETEGLASLTRETLQALQLARLNALLAKEKARGGFYRDLPCSLGSLRELSSLPFTTAKELSLHASAMLLGSQSQIKRVISGQTSGTQGAVKRVFYTEGDLRNTVGFFAAGLGELVFPGERVMIAMPFSGSGGLGDLIAQAIIRLEAEPLCVGVSKSYDELCSVLVAKRPSVYVGMPVPLLSLLRYTGGCSLKRALVSADATPQSVTEGAQAILGTKLFPHYGAREMGLGGAVTCPAHEGMHLRENHIIAEIIGPDGLPAPLGAAGELVVTTIGMQALPLIRYKTGDTARILRSPCACGGVTMRLDGVRRLAQDYDIVQLDEAMFRVSSLLDYSARLCSGRLEISALTKGPPEYGALESAASSCFPGLPVRLDARAANGGDIAGQAQKRILCQAGLAF